MKDVIYSRVDRGPFISDILLQSWLPNKANQKKQTLLPLRTAVLPIAGWQKLRTKWGLKDYRWENWDAKELRYCAQGHTAR